MKSSFGNNINFTLFGESHNNSIGITIQGLPVGFSINFDELDEYCSRRDPNKSYNTPRNEKTNYDIISGYFNNKITGTPFTVIFNNSDVRSSDYENVLDQPRPGHADYTAMIKYNNHHDYRGGGHFSGRLTLPIVFLGGILKQVFKVIDKDIKIVSYPEEYGNIKNKSYYELRKEYIEENNMVSSVKKFRNEFASLVEEYNTLAIDKEDTIGGNIATVIFNPPICLGEPFFNSFETTLSSLLYAIPSVKGVTFGYGLNYGKSYGSDVSDEIIAIEDKKIFTKYNYNGGINGGITNGEDIVFNTTLKPIASLNTIQNTYSISKQEVLPLKIKGRHDKTIINRVPVIIESCALITMYELYLENKKSLD